MITHKTKSKPTVKICNWIFRDKLNTSVEIYNWITVGISERANEVSVHPNPFQNNLSINSTEEIRDIIVYDIRGKIIQQVKPSTNRILIETSAWANGIYHLQVFTDKNVLVSKVVKTE